MTKRVIAYVPDLMDRSRLAGVDELTVVAAPEDLARAARAGDVVLVDLSRIGVLEALAVLPAGVASVGFSSHVDTAGIEAARAAGCQNVMPRSVFFRDPVAALTAATGG